MNHAIAEAVIKSIEQGHAAGESFSSIAKRLNVSVSTVKKYTRHLPRRPSANHLNPATLTEVKELSATDLTQAAIAKKLGLAPSTIRRYQRANGTKPRPRGRPRKTAADLAR